MRKDELYINGEIVDLDDKTKITLKYKSNLFTDLSKIVSNNSYTIKLPPTVHNQRVIDHADLPARVTDFPRKRHQTRYFRGGVEIVKDAVGVLLSTGETIDVAMTWGTITALRNLVSDNRMLNELTDGSEYLLWDQKAGIGPYDYTDDYFYSDASYGVKLGDASKLWYHPVVRVEWLLKKIESIYDVKIQVPDTYKSFFRRLVIPCLTRDESQGVLNDIVSLNYVAFHNHQIDAISYFQFSIKNSIGKQYATVYDRPFPGVAAMSLLFPSRDFTDTEVFIDIGITFSSLINPSNINLRFTYSKVDYKEPFSELIEGKNVFGMTFEFTKRFTIDRNIEEGYCYLQLNRGSDVTTIGTVNYFTFNISPKANGEVQYGERFPVVSNLPKIKVVDFLKNIMSLCALFSMPPEDSSNVLNFSNIELMIQNKNRAYDWTKKVVASYQENKPMSTTYTIENFAQHNRMVYKEDSTVFGNYDGDLIIEDETIETSRNAVELKFAASDTQDGRAKLPLYVLNEDSGEYELQNIEPRILLEAPDSIEYSKLVFSGLDWPTLINTYYAKYQSVIKRPVVISEKIEVSDIELQSLDVSVPVYLGQYGQFYGIIDIKAEDSGICTCNLLQLNF